MTLTVLECVTICQVLDVHEQRKLMLSLVVVEGGPKAVRSNGTRKHGQHCFNLRCFDEHYRAHRG